MQSGISVPQMMTWRRKGQGPQFCKLNPSVNAMQYLVDQHPDNLTILPKGSHKKSERVSLHNVAPKLVASKGKKRVSNSKGKGRRFLKKGSFVINDLATNKTLLLANLKSEEKAKPANGKSEVKPLPVTPDSSVDSSLGVTRA